VANSYLILYPKSVLEALLVKHPELVGLFWEALNSMTNINGQTMRSYNYQNYAMSLLIN
jgi:hypothetical protein